MSRFTLLTIAASFLALASGCCGGPCCGRPLAAYNYNPVYPTAYAPTYPTAYGVPAQGGCSSCGGGVAPF